MARAESISERLPHFYKHWDDTTAVSSIVGSVGKSLDEAGKGFVDVMRAHWADTAAGDDLDRIGGVFSIARKAAEADEDYRGRLKTAVLSYKGGGTPNAVRMMVRIALALPQDYPVIVDENPEITIKKTWKVRAGTEFTVNPRNTREAEPEITVEVESDNVKISDPTVKNVDTGASVMFKGELSKGDVLKIKGTGATLNGKDVSARLTGTAPALPRKRTKWQYSEAIGANLGVFDRAQFDRSVFSVDVMSAITLEWAANQPAAFDVVLEKKLLDKSGVTRPYLQEILNMAKGCGVKAGIRLVEAADKGGI